MRKFYLINNVGTTYFFDFRSNTLISSIDDIGYEIENTYLDYENSFKKVDEKIPQGTINFSLIFLDGYEGYSSFLEFIRNSKDDLRLFYKLGSETKYMYVAFKSITKTELESRVIKSKLTLEKLSLWLNKVSYFIKVSIDKKGKTYSYTYPYTYATSYQGEVSVINNGEYKSPLLISIIGAVNNPLVEVIKDDEVISSLKLLVSSSSCQIEVNAEPSNQYMKMIENEVSKNIYQEQDFNYDNFLFLERGTFTIRFTPGVEADTKCKIIVSEVYGGH